MGYSAHRTAVLLKGKVEDAEQETEYYLAHRVGALPRRTDVHGGHEYRHVLLVLPRGVERLHLRLLADHRRRAEQPVEDVSNRRVVFEPHPSPLRPPSQEGGRIHFPFLKNNLQILFNRTIL